MPSTELIELDCYSNETGQSFAPAPIPNNPLLVGNNYYAQMIWAEDSGNGRACSAAQPHLVSSRGLAIAIQP
jgi:hypothetical protein